MGFGKAEVTQLMEMIWSSVLDWDVRPAEDTAKRTATDEFVTGMISITGAWTGSVLLRCHREVTTEAAARMYGIPADQLSGELVLDALGELTNMLAGNLKGLLTGPCRLGLPTVDHGRDIPLTFDCRPTLQAAFQCDTRLLFVEIREGLPTTDDRQKLVDPTTHGNIPRR